MRRLIESTLISLDGVTEGPERWANFDAEDTSFALDQLADFGAFIMGRVTYEDFFANWGQTSGSPYIDTMNATAQVRRSHEADGDCLERHSPRTGHSKRTRPTES